MRSVNDEIDRLRNLIYDANPQSACGWQRILAPLIGEVQRRYVIEHSPYNRADLLLDEAKKERAQLDPRTVRATSHPVHGVSMAEAWPMLMQHINDNSDRWCVSLWLADGGFYARSFYDDIELGFLPHEITAARIGHIPVSYALSPIGAFAELLVVEYDEVIRLIANGPDHRHTSAFHAGKIYSHAPRAVGVFGPTSASPFWSLQHRTHSGEPNDQTETKQKETI